MTVLVAGGAGYIGAHVVRLLQQQGRKVVVVDNLTTGAASRIGDAVLVNLDIAADTARAPLAALLREHEVTAVINFAAESHVDRSIADGSTFVRTNCMGTNVLCDVANTVGVDKDAGRGSPGGRS